MTDSSPDNQSQQAHAPQPLWQQAASWAARHHRHQLRKDHQTPYAAHPFRVAMTVRDLFGCDDQPTLAAALLHDLIEDTTVDYDDLAETFGDQVAQLVADLSKDPRRPEPEREAAYDENLAKADWRARLIKLADVYDNLSDAPDPQRRAGMRIKAQRALDIAGNEPQLDQAKALLARLIADHA